MAVTTQVIERTRLQLRTDARRASDQASNGSDDFVSDAELNDYLNQAIVDTYNVLLDGTGETLFKTSQSIAMVAGTATYALEVDFYRLLGVDVALADGSTYVMLPVAFHERHKYVNMTGWSRFVRPGYYLTTDIDNGTPWEATPQITFLPTPDGTETVTIHYVPAPPQLTGDTDKVSLWGAHEHVALGAAVRMLEKEESDATHLLRRMGMLEQRFKKVLSSRDAGPPTTVTDAETLEDVYWPY